MFTLTIETDNDAFSADPGAEIARILRFAADQVAGNGISSLRDINGNTVGNPLRHQNRQPLTADR